MSRRRPQPTTQLISPRSPPLPSSDDDIEMPDASSLSLYPPNPNTPPNYPPPIPIPPNLTQAMVESNPRLHRLQRDLLILTSFNENETLHWRPAWFAQGECAGRFWTLFNPPDVVTEVVPCKSVGRVIYTRRMRRQGDRAAAYVKSWEEWERICDLRGVPRGWLNMEMVGLMRLGLMRDGRGGLVEPPTYPLYPEPQPLGKGRYILSPSTYPKLPTKFHNVRIEAEEEEDKQVVVVHSNGALAIEPRYEYFLHESQWTHFNGTGGYISTKSYVPDPDKGMKEQGRGRRWSWLPWTDEMEESCCGLLVKLKVRTQRARGGRGL